MISKEFISQHFPKGQLTLVGGRPKSGKTALTASLALNLGHEEDKCSLIFSLEFCCTMLVDRYIKRIYYSKFKDCGDKIYVDDTPWIKLSQVRSRIDSLKPDYVFIDYIQLIETDTKKSREEELNHIVLELKIMARELNIPIIATVSLGRSIKSGKPDIDDLKWIMPESVDNVNIILLYWCSYFRSADPIEASTELIRYVGGMKTSSFLYFDKENIEFSEWLNWESVKEEFHNSDHWLVTIDSDDVERFEKDGNESIRAVAVSTYYTSEENRFHELVHTLKDQVNAIIHRSNPNQMLVLIQFPESAPLTMSEMNLLNNIFESDSDEDDFHNIEILWGAATRDDDTIRIICAIR